MKEIEYGTLLLKVKDFKSEQEALEFAKKQSKWQEQFTDEQYLKEFGHPKKNITNFRKAFVRRIPRWFDYMTDCGTEWDCRAVYYECEKGGRGAAEYYLYEDEYAEHDYWKWADKQEREYHKRENMFERLAEEDDSKKIL